MARESKRKRDERRFGRPERLADLVAGNLWEPPAWCREPMSRLKEYAETWKALRDDLRSKVASAKLVVTDNVSDYYFEHPKNDWTYKTDFPCVTPPFPTLFIEARRPAVIVSGSHRQAPAAWVPDRYGFLFESMESDEVNDNLETHHERYLQFLNQQLDSLYPFVNQSAVRAAAALGNQKAAWDSLGETERLWISTAKGLREIEANPNAADRLAEGYKDLGLKWLVRATLIVASYNGVVCGPLIDWTIFVGERGNILVDPSPTIYLGGADPDPELTREVRDALATFLPPGLLALCFMNCKNIIMTSVNPDPALNRERRKAGLKPFVRYHTINIEPMKTVLKTEGRIETEGLKKALHICRGHFATYATSIMGRPLVEPLTVWRPSHVRGSVKQGVIVSDYRVGGPKKPDSPAVD